MDLVAVANLIMKRELLVVMVLVVVANPKHKISLNLVLVVVTAALAVLGPPQISNFKLF